MAQPIPNLPSPASLDADGAYNVATKPGLEHLLTLQGTWDGATATLYVYNTELDDVIAVNGGAWTANAEERFIPPSSVISVEISSAGASTAIALTCIPIIQ